MAPLPGGLGRHEDPDPKDALFPVTTLLRAIPFAPPAYRVWPFNHAYPLDQGNTGTCVGHGFKHQLMAAPGRTSFPMQEPRAITIYREACPLDPWPENDDGNLQHGTSVRAGAEALLNRNLIQSYWWANTLQDCVDHLLLRGPLVLGWNWYESMFYPTSKGYITPSGGVVGGHCLLAIGVIPAARRIRLLNSWGGNWGQNGRVWVSYDTFERLMDEDGEACTTVEARP